MFFSFAFCTFFKIFHVRLGKKSKSVSFSRVYVCVKAKLTLVSFFLLFFSCTFPLLNQLKSFQWHFFLISQTQIFCKLTATGWSFATAIFYIFLTGTKKQQNHITQSFLSTSYIDILIFWGLTMVRWKKSCLSRLCQNSVMAPYCKG